MTKKEAMYITEGEGLKGYNFDGKNYQANEVGTVFENGVWKVFCTDEKAEYRIIKEYNSEGEAIEHVIECLRLDKRFEERRKRRGH